MPLLNEGLLTAIRRGGKRRIVASCAAGAAVGGRESLAELALAGLLARPCGKLPAGIGSSISCARHTLCPTIGAAGSGCTQLHI